MSELMSELKARIHRSGTPLTVVFGVTTVILAVYIYHLQRRERELTYYVHPVRTIIAKAGVASSLHVFHGDKEITDDITGAQIAIENRGNEPIRTGDILSQVEVILQPSVSILEARILDVSREVVEFRLDDSHLADGVIPVFWKILEGGDGAVIQVIYQGGEDVSIEVAGVIVGQRGIEPLPLFTTTPKTLLKQFVIASVVGLFCFAVGLSIRKWLGKNVSRKLGIKSIGYIHLKSLHRLYAYLGVVFLIFAILWLVLWLLIPGPPFGFP